MALFKPLGKFLPYWCVERMAKWFQGGLLNVKLLQEDLDKNGGQLKLYPLFEHTWLLSLTTKKQQKSAEEKEKVKLAKKDKATKEQIESKLADIDRIIRQQPDFKQLARDKLKSKIEDLKEEEYDYD